jgi:hypothetical protein
MLDHLHPFNNTSKKQEELGEMDFCLKQFFTTITEILERTDMSEQI